MANLVALSLGPADGAAVPVPVRDLLDVEDFALTPRAATLAALAQSTGGTALDLVDLPRLSSLLPDPQPVQRTATTVVRLWVGAWPLALLLGLVSAEYLLRRRAGRVM